MASFAPVATGANAKGTDVQQVIDALSGTGAAANTPLSVSGVNDPANFALKVRNAGAGAKGLVVYAADGTTVMLQVDSTGVKASSDGIAAAAAVINSSGAVANRVYGGTGPGTASWRQLTFSDVAAGTLTTDNALVDSTAKALVGAQTTQTLTNKTLTQPTIGDFTLAPHTHTSLAQGGIIVVTSPASVPAADVPLVANTWTNVTTISVSAGNWVIAARLLVFQTGGDTKLYQGAIWDGTNYLTWTPAAASSASNHTRGPDNLFCFVSPGGTTTYTLRVWLDAAALNTYSAIKTMTLEDNASTVPACYLCAFKVG